MNEELLDLVNAKDEVIGLANRKDIYKNKLSNFRTINAFIVRNNRDVWIPTRTKEKELWSYSYDASVGGYVKTGETYQEALFRETAEEVNLDLNRIPFYPIAKLSSFTHSVSSFMMLYIIHHNRNIKYNKDDFCNSTWISPCQLFQDIEKGVL